MRSQWSDKTAREVVEDCLARHPGSCNEDIGLRVYSSRLIGREPRLVLHGGGNTSVKTTLPDELGGATEVLCVKGSGWNLADLDVPGLPAVRLDTLAALRELDSLSDERMVNAARTRLLDAGAPNPSVETLLHAFLPHRFIDHSHADSILALVDQPEAERLCTEVYGDRLAIVPYIMPGFALAKLAAEIYERQPDCEGLLLLQHGLFTFGETARVSYERHVEMVDLAERALGRRRAQVASPKARRLDSVDHLRLAPVLRGHLGAGERHWVLELRAGESIRRFVDREDLVDVASRGPATPDHVIRTKQFPLVLDVSGRSAEDLDGLVATSVAGFRDRYREYFERQTSGRKLQRTMLDPDPRVVLVPGLGMITVGSNPGAASIAADLYEHTMGIIEDAEAAGRYQALPEDDIFDMEYWSLEQAKLGRKSPKAFAGRIVVVTGAASGIGEATARKFATAGATVFLIDRDASALVAVADSLSCSYHVADLCDEADVDDAIDACVRAHGGIDGVISNAGTAPQSPIAKCTRATLLDSLQINLLAHQQVAARAVEVMRAQGHGGFLLFNASKAAFNPGPGFGPYAIAKAALVALMKQHALEGGADGIRSNAINADRVQTGLLPREVVEARARARGLEVDDYFRSNLLRRVVTAEDVAQAFLHLAEARSTSGTVLTVDGGNIAASPR